MKKILIWLVASSANSEKVSLFVKGVLLGVVPFLVTLFGLAHINVGQSDLTAVIDGIAVVIQVGLGLVSAVMAVVGLVRKIWRTVQGENRALNELK